MNNVLFKTLTEFHLFTVSHLLLISLKICTITHQCPCKKNTDRSLRGVVTQHTSLCSVCWHWRGQVATLIYHVYFFQYMEQRDRVYCSSIRIIKKCQRMSDCTSIFITVHNTLEEGFPQHSWGKYIHIICISKHLNGKNGKNVSQ